MDDPSIWLIATVAVVAFTIGFVFAKIIDQAAVVLTTTRQVVSNLSDPGLSDDQKEAISRKATILLFRKFLDLVWRSLLVLVAPTLIIAAAVMFGLATADQMYDFLSRWDVLVIFTAAVGLYFWGATKWQ